MTPGWSKTTSKMPTLAPADYRTLPARTSDYPETDNYLNVWRGSGFQPHELPCYPRGRETPGYPFLNKDKCGKCGSTDTSAIFLCNWYDQSGADIELEIECRACGTYTQYYGFA